ncbi:NAD(P)H-dependent flavin oxidoreductase [Pseudonocardia sp. T1-2H]|uniref:NAD(P)H-dependent flavin oxidoreductase n=1 Tax=Pseudonocardia sp. T1-2H TaxID=3128899 RepID=UPI0031019D8A
MFGDASIPTQLTREYGLRHPFVSAGMGFVAYERLAAAVAEAGGLGMLGATPDPPESLEVMVGRLRAVTTGAWGVDLIHAQTGLGPACHDGHIEACARLRVPLVVFHHDLPSAEWVRRLVAAGARVWMQVSSVELAVGALQLGVHGLVAQGSEAGGHARGTVPLLALLDQVRRRAGDVLLLAAGGISDGAAVAAALRAGADGVWVGTRMVAAEEAYAHREYQARLVASPGATVRTTKFGPEWPDQPYRLLATAFAQGQPAPPTEQGAEAPIGHTRLFPHSANVPYGMPPYCALPPTPDTAGNWDLMAYPAGQGVGAVRAVAPAADIIAEMMAEAAAELARPLTQPGR